jgi:hypothetical protein
MQCFAAFVVFFDFIFLPLLVQKHELVGGRASAGLELVSDELAVVRVHFVQALIRQTVAVA